MTNEVELLKQRIEQLEAENQAFKRVNEELCKAVNSGKHKRLLSALIAKYSQ